MQHVTIFEQLKCIHHNRILFFQYCLQFSPLTRLLITQLMLFFFFKNAIKYFLGNLLMICTLDPIQILSGLGSYIEKYEASHLRAFSSQKTLKWVIKYKFDVVISVLGCCKSLFLDIKKNITSFFLTSNLMCELETSILMLL